MYTFKILTIDYYAHFFRIIFLHKLRITCCILQNMTIIAEQIRAARAILDWSRDDLATATGLSADTVRRIESGSLQPRASTVAAIRAAFERRGIEFLPNNGVARHDNTVSVLEGSGYLVKLFDDIYHTLKDTGGEVLLLCADDRTLEPEVMLAENRLRAAGIRFRQLVEANNDAHVGNANEYRTIPSAYFHHEMQVVYGTKVASCISSKQKAVVINDTSWAIMARKTFDLMWQHAAPASARARNTGNAR